MSIISSIFNQGTGLITPISEGQLPIVVDDLTVNGNLTVLGTSNLVQDVTCGDNLIVAQTTTTQNLVVNNNSIMTNGIGQNNSALIKLPLTTGTNNQVLSILNDAVNPKTTQWITPSTINDYVQYDTGTSKLKNNVLSVITDINDLTVDNSIGLTGQRFKLPSNTSSATNNQVLAILNSSVNPKTTSWITPTVIAPTTALFENNIIGVTTVSTIAATIVNTSVLTPGIYIINYEVKFNATARVFTYQGFGCTLSSGSLSNNPIIGLQQACSIPYTAPTLGGLFQEPKFTGCGVLNISTSQTVFLVVLNNFTGASYTTFGSIRYTKLS
jgi:hypothetical protein